MIIMTAEALAEHLAGSIDGDYDDGLEAHVMATAAGGTIALTLCDETGDEPTRFKITVEAV